jgi:hypothetical protein
VVTSKTLHGDMKLHVIGVCPTSLISGSPRSRPVAPPDGFRANDQENGMTGFSSDDDEMRRLLELSEEVTRIAAALADLSLGLTGGPGSAEDAKRSGNRRRTG